MALINYNKNYYILSKFFLDSIPINIYENLYDFDWTDDEAISKLDDGIGGSIIVRILDVLEGWFHSSILLNSEGFGDVKAYRINMTNPDNKTLQLREKNDNLFYFCMYIGMPNKIKITTKSSKTSKTSKTPKYFSIIKSKTNLNSVTSDIKSGDLLIFDDKNEYQLLIGNTLNLCSYFLIYTMKPTVLGEFLNLLETHEQRLPLKIEEEIGAAEDCILCCDKLVKENYTIKKLSCCSQIIHTSCLITTGKLNCPFCRATLPDTYICYFCNEKSCSCKDSVISENKSLIMSPSEILVILIKHLFLVKERYEENIHLNEQTILSMILNGVIPLNMSVLDAILG